MTLTLLLDLDDTLLNTNLERFIPAYFQALATELAVHVQPDLMLRALASGTLRMKESADFSRTLEEVFASEFYPPLNASRGELDSAVENFYDRVFPGLAGLTAPKPTTRPFVNWAISQGFRLAIATDPILPRKAAYHRVRWAGLDPDQFEIISTYDEFHFSKTHPAYYAELLGRMGWPDGPVLMAGNDIERDILPAQKLGLATFHIDEYPNPRSILEDPRRGDLQSLRSWLESTDLTTLIPSLRSIDSVMGVLRSTPAVVLGLTHGLPPSAWCYESGPEEWTLTELVCHLRDTEREVHHAQLKIFHEQKEPFVPRPDTAVWASQREYREEDGQSALLEFLSARKETIELLTTISDDNWSRKARHAIFGPTDFLEVVKFMADHDRLHIQQAWRLLQRDQ